MRNSVPISQCQFVVAAHERCDRELAWLPQDHRRGGITNPNCTNPFRLVKRLNNRPCTPRPMWCPRIRVIVRHQINLRFCFVTYSTPIILGQYDSIHGMPNECFQSLCTWSAVLQGASNAKQIPVFLPDDQWGDSLCMPLPRGSSCGPLLRWSQSSSGGTSFVHPPIPTAKLRV